MVRKRGSAKEKERDEGEESREGRRREGGGKEERLGEGGGCGWEENRKVQEDKGEGVRKRWGWREGEAERQ